MKKLFLAISAAIALLSCNLGSGQNEETEAKEQKKISKIDRSITPANAYNNLFLDSSKIEQFLVDKKIPDSIAWRIRSFYNSRNFEFAWFSSDGLTEQARGFWNLHNNYTSSTDDSSLDNKSLQKRMDNFVEDTIFPSAKNKSFINTEIELTSHFIKHTLLAYEPEYVKRKEMERFVPAKKQDALYNKSKTECNGSFINYCKVS